MAPRPPIDSPTDPYVLESLLDGLPAAARAAAERAALQANGHPSLALWKEHHALGVALGRPLDEFPAGPYAFYATEGVELAGLDPIPEHLEAADLDALAEAAGLDQDVIDELDDDELCGAIEEVLGEACLGESSDGFLKLAEAPTLFALLRLLIERDVFGPDLAGPPQPGDALHADARLDAMPRPERFARFKAIKDLRLRRIAMALQGADQSLEFILRREDSHYCQNILLRRSDWDFVCAWDADPPLQDLGLCILRRQSPAHLRN